MSATSNVEMKEILPELREFYCRKCFSAQILNEIFKQQLRTVNLTLNLLEPAEDEKGVSWGVLCIGKDANEYSELNKPHLAEFEVIRHKIVAQITTPVTP